MVDWTQLARDVGSLRPDGSEQGSSALARLALERVLGEDTVRGAVEHVVEHRPGGELAMNVLRELVSQRAAELAYEVYTTSSGARARAGAWLLGQVAHPCSVPWIPKLLADPEVAAWGAGLLDQLLWCGRVEPAEVEHLLSACEHHTDAGVRERAAFIRDYLARRAREAHA